MNIAICATKNMYAQLRAMVAMLKQTQPKLECVYAFVEDDTFADDDIVKYIDVSRQMMLRCNLNANSKWSYMALARCYFTKLLPNVSKVLYLDLDIIIDKDISKLWDMDVTDYAVAGVIDCGIRKHNLPYVPSLNTYINSGVLLMNLDYIRANGLDERMDDILNHWSLCFPDQDALNIVCYDRILFLDPIWNSSFVTTESPEGGLIRHFVLQKPWDPNSAQFETWLHYYNS